MTQQEILNSNLNKTHKAKKLFELGFNRQEVAQLLGINYGFAHNIYANLYPERIRATRRQAVRNIAERFRLNEFVFNHKFGIEIEGYDCNRSTLSANLTSAGIKCQSEGYNHQTRDYWKVIGDSSLEGINTFELVSPILEGEQGLTSLKLATYVLRGNKVKVNKSCGLHIHFDAEGFDLDTWKRLYINYAKIEKIIDSFMPESRRGGNNRYCKSMIVPDYERKIKNATSLESIERAVTNRNRYFKLNTQSYWRHKSVEFRQHSGTINYEKIENWILFLARLIEYSKNAIIQGNTWEDVKDFLPNEIHYFLKMRADELR